MSNICRCQEPRTNQEGKTTSRIIEEVTYCSLARRPENARTWDKAHRNRKVAEVRDLSFCAGGRLTLARAHKDANSTDCADCDDSECENTDCVCECRSTRTAPTMGSPAAGSVWPPGIRMPNGKDCADCVCECRSKRTAPTMGSPAAGSVWPPGSRRMLLAGSVWPPGIRMPTADIALILCVNAGASAWHPRCAAQRQEASGRQEFGCQR